ncbi:ATP-binding protein [Nocardia fluminea]|uniref:ATP-binding protein n=1 Tax=Nocardia TaxID=1817 RepID=UPI0033D436E1
MPKVAIVVVCPLVATLLLGSARVASQISGVVDLANTSEHVRGLRAVVEFEVAATIVAGRTAAGTLVTADPALLVPAIVNLDAVRHKVGLPGEAVAAIDTMIALARQFQSTAANPKMSLQSLLEVHATIASSADAVVESILAPLNSAEVIGDKNRLLDLWAAQRQLFAVAVGVITVVQNPADSGHALTAAVGGHNALLDRLSRYYPADDRRLGSLHAAQATEAPLLDAVRAAIPYGPSAVRDAGYGHSLIKDQAVYADLVGEATEKVYATVDAYIARARLIAIRDTVLLLATLAIGLVVAVWVGRALVRPLGRLHVGARRVAEIDLPTEIERISTDGADETPSFVPVDVHSDEEIGRVARAVDDIHRQALRLARQQHHLRSMVNDLFDVLAQRMRSLIDRQLHLIGSLESREEDADRLADLFQLDHLATRMRRHADNLLILSGTAQPSQRTGPLPIAEVLRASVSEVEDYQRVRLRAASEFTVTGDAVTDLVHLIAELLDNALRGSPSHTPVYCQWQRSFDGGAVIDIIDYGTGVEANELRALNDRLTASPEIGPETARRMGLFVVGRLAEKHNVIVQLRPTHEDTFAAGITATVCIPGMLVRAPASTTNGSLSQR